MKNIIKRAAYFADYKISEKVIDVKLSNSIEFISKPLEIITVPLDFITHECTYEGLTPIRRQKSMLFKQVIYKNGAILDGDWDLYKSDYSKSIQLKEFRERFVDKKAWEETHFYQRFTKHSDTNNLRNAKNWEDFKTRYLHEWDKLYDDIKNNGYKSNYELTGKPGEVIVCISRTGEIMRTPFGGGNHRFAIAKILGIKEIPVVVSVWHKQYIEGLKEKFNFKTISPKKAIQPILQKTGAEKRE
jgi:hypothetical protein